MLRSIERSRGTGPRATVFGTARFTVGRGPVPRHAPIAGETRSDARMAEGPRATEPETIAGDRPPRYGIQHAPLYRRARACPSPCCVNRKIARDRPSRYGPGRKKARGTGPRATVIERSRGKPARMRVWHPRAPALRLFGFLHSTKRRQHPIRRGNRTRQQPRH